MSLQKVDVHIDLISPATRANINLLSTIDGLLRALHENSSKNETNNTRNVRAY